MAWPTGHAIAYRPRSFGERPISTDPLAQVVGLLRPDLSYVKLVEAAGSWRVQRMGDGHAFFFAILEGAVRLALPGQPSLLIEGGDFVLIPAAQSFTASGATGEPPAGLDSVPEQVQPHVFRLGDRRDGPDARMLVGHCAFGSPDAELITSLLPSLIHARGERRLTTLIQLAVEESRGALAAREVILARLMEVLFIEALRSSAGACPGGLLRGLGDGRVAAAIRAIHARPDVAWDVSTLAKAAAMSRSAFFEAFRRTVGMAPMEYLLHWRMVLAKRLLEEGKPPVADVARRVGYGSASTFSTAFSRHVGTSPALYARIADLEGAHENRPITKENPLFLDG